MPRPLLFKALFRRSSTAMLAATSITVTTNTSLKDSSSLPSHHRNQTKSLFANPWSSFRHIGRIELFKAIVTESKPSVPQDITSQLPIRKPDWGLSSTKSSNQIKATWLGHAAFLVELPPPETKDSDKPSRGIRILFDPVFSQRCSPLSFMGPARYTPPPCTVEELPDIDLIVISHNHYDHMDTGTIKPLFQRPNKPHIFAPLNNDSLLSSMGIPKSHFHCLDWWESADIQVTLPSSPVASVRLTCTPCQHVSARTPFDKMHTLWSSWAVEETTPSSSTKSKVWFAGDTGYRTIRSGEDPDNVPTCPAFKEIGEKFGGFDLALIPIGAYQPQETFSGSHVNPTDSVNIFKDVQAKRALAMHWGTWVLTLEECLDPPKHLEDALKKAGVEKNLFTTCDIGETTFIEPGP